MARTEAPASSESHRQQQLTTPAATAPLLDSTIASVAGCARLDLSTSEMGHRTKALRASLWRAGNVGWLIAWE
jgi:hypothetical protein